MVRRLLSNHYIATSPTSLLVRYDVVLKTRKMLNDPSQSNMEQLVCPQPLASTQTREEMRASLKEQIILSKQHTASLEAKLNDLADTARLPNEVLAQIFLEYKSLWIAPGSYGFKEPAILRKRRQKLRWLRIAHICRHWRQVALDLAALWTDIQLKSDKGHDFQRYQIRHSKNIPLHFTVYLDNFPGPNPNARTTNLMKAQIHRIKTLDITGCSPTIITQGSLRRISDGAPILERLQLRLCCVPQGFLSGGTPCLRTLVLDHCFSTPQDWAGLQSDRLEELTINSPTNPLTWQELCGVLSGISRSLKTLKMTHGLPFSTSEQNTPMAELVHFPHLEVLVLEDESVAVSSMLSSLRIPSTCRIALQPYLAESWDPEPRFRDVLTAISLARSCNLTPKSLTIELYVYEAIDNFHLDFDDDSDDPDGAKFYDGHVKLEAADSWAPSTSEPPSNILEMTFHLPYLLELFDQSFPFQETNLPGLSFGNISRLCFSSLHNLPDFTVPPSVWATISRIPSLHTLDIYQLPCLGLLASLSSNQTAVEDSQRAFPALQELFLTGVDDLCMLVEPESSKFIPGLDILTEDIRNRRRRGQALTTLEFVDCDFSMPDRQEDELKALGAVIQRT